MSLMNSSEDLSGLGRPDLVYKAKLAEQAERCAFADLVHFFFFNRELLRMAGKGFGDRVIVLPKCVACGRRRKRARPSRTTCIVTRRRLNI